SATTGRCGATRRARPSGRGGGGGAGGGGRGGYGGSRFPSGRPPNGGAPRLPGRRWASKVPRLFRRPPRLFPCPSPSMSQS
ncbi:hypothetical protein EJ591_03125, partial [Pseudomonas aeruginosa]